MSLKRRCTVLLTILIVITMCQVASATTAENWYKTGKAFQEKGDYAGAIEAYDKAIALDPKNPSYWNHKGASFLVLEKYEESIEAFDKSIEFSSRKGTAAAGSLFGKGRALSALGRYDEAVVAFDETIALYPDQATAWNGKGEALASQGKFAAAIEAYDKAIALKSDYDLAKRNRALALAKLQESPVAASTTQAAGQPIPALVTLAIGAIGLAGGWVRRRE